MLNKKILIADDDSNIRVIVQMEFEALGYEVILAEDGEDALNKIFNEKPDLILLDVMMPKKDGYDVCHQLKNDPQYRDIPIVMLTAKTQKEDKYWGREVGADEYITKPFDPEELEGIVDRILRLKEKGESYHPLTRLPMLTSIEREIKKREEDGEKFSVYHCFYDPEAFNIYKQKYGNVKVEEVIQLAGSMIKDKVDEIYKDKGFVGHLGDDTFVIIVPPEKLELLMTEIDRTMKDSISFHYNEEDGERGHVMVKDVKGEIQEYPLLSLQWTSEDKEV